MMSAMGRLPGADPLLILAVVLVSGTLLGFLARRAMLPAVTGQIIAGVILGPSVLALFDTEAVAGLEPLTHFALALIGVTVGAHLNIQRLRNAVRRLFWLMLTEALVTPLVVLALLRATDTEPTLGFLLATLAVSTAPATVVALVRETRAKGVFVKTLVAAVALNNIACIFLFELAREAGRITLTGASLEAEGALQVLAQAGLRLGAAIGVGVGAAVAAHVVSLRVVIPDRLTTLSVTTLLLTFGLASYLGVSPLAASLALGVAQTNLSPERERIADSVFHNFEPVILCVFFTLAGMHLDLEHAMTAGSLAGLFVVGRTVGKIVSSNLAMRIAGATDRVRRWLGPALLPQAGVAVGLVILIQGDPAFAGIEQTFTVVVLTAVTFFEIVGPLTTRVALTRAREVGLDRPRLVDFLQEENIRTDLEGRDFDHTLEQLVDLLIRSHQLVGVDRDALLRSVREREAEVSTCLGEGLAVPHGELPEGFEMAGVMGLSQRGLDFPTPDGRLVHCVVLLATPRGERDRHLEVLAALARTIGSDPAVQERLYNAKTPAHAYEILHGEQTEEFNYFLGEDQLG